MITPNALDEPLITDRCDFDDCEYARCSCAETPAKCGTNRTDSGVKKHGL